MIVWKIKVLRAWCGLVEIDEWVMTEKGLIDEK